MRTLIVWHNLNKDTYYYRFYNYNDYPLGYKNQYNHEIVLILKNEEIQPIKIKVSLQQTLLTPIIHFLKWIIEFLEKINK